ncbi:unnamed protein product, partial [Schistosoma mattheei]
FEIRFSSSHFRKQHPWCEKAVSRTSLAEAVYAWPCESISRGRADSPHSRPYEGIPTGSQNPCTSLVWNYRFPTPLGGLSVSTKPVKALDICFSSSRFRKQHTWYEKVVSRISLVSGYIRVAM